MGYVIRVARLDFLRLGSGKLVCDECHGYKALFGSRG